MPMCVPFTKSNLGGCMVDIGGLGYGWIMIWIIQISCESSWKVCCNNFLLAIVS